MPNTSTTVSAVKQCSVVLLAGHALVLLFQNVVERTQFLVTGVFATIDEERGSGINAIFYTFFLTGKVYALAGYTSAVCLALVALIMGFESVSRLVHPVTIHFREAMPVAVIGLIVNLVSVKLLDYDEHHSHEHEHDHGHEPSDSDSRHHHDHNLRAAYFHVLADALTSVLAISALCAGQFFRWTFLDPVMGIIGGLVILRWSWGLCHGAARQLLDACPSQKDEDRLRVEFEAIDDVRVVDLRLWEVGPGRRSCIASLVTSEPREADFYRNRARSILDLSYVTVEVHRCRTGHEHAA